MRDRATFAALARARRFRAGPLWLRSISCGASVATDPAVAYAITRAAGNAVDRNRIRRRLRAAVARHERELDSDMAYLFGGDRRLLHAPFASIDRAIGDALRASREMNE
ncbi:MAG: ribonuclease P protein component, partial [Acidimicrobiia bacterium]